MLATQEGNLAQVSTGGQPKGSGPDVSLAWNLAL